MTITDNSPMPFGKHEGEKMANVPAPYLLNLKRRFRFVQPCGKLKAVMDYIEENKEVLEQEVKQGR